MSSAFSIAMIHRRACFFQSPFTQYYAEGIFTFTNSRYCSRAFTGRIKDLILFATVPNNCSVSLRIMILSIILKKNFNEFCLTLQCHYERSNSYNRLDYHLCRLLIRMECRVNILYTRPLKGALLHFSKWELANHSRFKSTFCCYGNKV